MANVSLAPGAGKLGVADMIKDVENGIYIIGDGSFSIDQQRYNAQFGGQLFYEIKDGRITGMIEDVAYQIRTPEFWNSCAAVCDAGDYRLRRLVLRRQGAAEPVLGRLARLEHRALQRRERHQHRAQAGLSGPAAGDTP